MATMDAAFGPSTWENDVVVGSPMVRAAWSSLTWTAGVVTSLVFNSIFMGVCKSPSTHFGDALERLAVVFLSGHRPKDLWRAKHLFVD